MKRAQLGVGAKSLARGSTFAQKPASTLARTPLAARKPGRALSRNASPDGLDKVHFRARVPANRKRCALCHRKATTYHHLTTQHDIRVYVRGLRLPDDDARPLLRDLLRDERNLIPADGACHERIENHIGSHPVALVEAKVDWDAAYAFAADMGREWVAVLMRRYPGTQAHFK